MKLTKILASAAAAGAIAAGAVGLSAVTASAARRQFPHPASRHRPCRLLAESRPATGMGAAGSPPPAWAMGNPQVWDDGWQHWGVWKNGVFIPTY